MIKPNTHMKFIIGIIKIAAVPGPLRGTLTLADICRIDIESSIAASLFALFRATVVATARPIRHRISYIGHEVGVRHIVREITKAF